jgi:hypothetical protein
MSMTEAFSILGNLGEFVGAIGVVATLVYLSIQVRQSRTLIEANNSATEENTRLIKAETMDRYNEVVSRWRGRLIEDEQVASIWRSALRGETIEGVDAVRLENLWIDWINAYRSNYRRADAVGDEGLKRQAVRSVVTWLRDCSLFLNLWEWTRPFNEDSSPDFVSAVDKALAATEELIDPRESPLHR